jgi:inner membrane protein
MIIGLFAAAPFATGEDHLILGVIGALLPDIDHPKSFIGRYNPFAYFMTHRGFTHTVLGCVVFALPFVTIGAGAVVFVGAMSHILTDWVSSWGRWKIKWY